MSAVPTNTAPDLVNIEIDGRAMQVPKGSMIIQAADRAQIPVPRFCYHDRLPIAANCRMCLVDVEKSPKPVPACATPVMEGMKIYTRSKRALDSQRNVMEFLLINHPLDCPICDQGGECELQDLAMGYGRSVSRFTERKRVVADEDLGPLVATDMTRCIHCTRCVRFVSEIAGTYELGGMGRGEHLEIGTYIGKTIESELSGNVVDVCPVGALTNKVFRFRARAWELTARESVAYHDALGSNLYLHVRRGEVLRTVPREHDDINECWLSDRDRYSHQGLYATDRVTQPLIRKNGQLQAVAWDEAIGFVAQGLRAHAASLAALVAPMATCEEGYLIRQLLQGLGEPHCDHRLRVTDPHDRHGAEPFECALRAMQEARCVLLIGSHPRTDQPMLGHRLRQAVRRGAQVFAINPLDWDLGFRTAGKRIVHPDTFVPELAALAQAVAAGDAQIPHEWLSAAAVAAPEEAHRNIASALRSGKPAVVLLGDFAAQHPDSSALRQWAQWIARTAGAAYNALPHGANSMGLSRLGLLPQTERALGTPQILASDSQALWVYQAGAQDFANAVAFQRLRTQAAFYVHTGAYACAEVHASAHAVLPIGLPPEVDGSFMNVDGLVQGFAAGGKLPGSAQPGWRVLRALGAALGLPGFDFTEFSQVQARSAEQLRVQAPSAPSTAPARPPARPQQPGLARIATVPMYRSDVVVRRATALQETPWSRPPAAAIHPDEARRLQLADGAAVRVRYGDAAVSLPLRHDPRVPPGCVWIEGGHAEVAPLGPTGARLVLEKVGDA